MRNGMRPVHPGEVLREDYLAELGMSAAALARALHVPTNRITGVLNGERAVTADTALRLARYFGTTPEFWMNMQATYELRTAEIESGKKITAEIKPHEIASKPVPRASKAAAQEAGVRTIHVHPADAVDFAARVLRQIRQAGFVSSPRASAHPANAAVMTDVRRAEQALSALRINRPNA